MGNRSVNRIGVNELTNFPGQAGSSIVPGDTPPTGITWQSKPNPDGWGPDSFWTCTDWLTWSKALRAHYGVAEGDRRWIEAFDKSSYGAHEISCSVQSNEFKDYVLTNGLADKSSILSRVYRAEKALADTTQPLKSLWESIKNISRGIENATEGAADSAKSWTRLLKILPWLLIGAALIALYFIVRNTKASDVAAAAKIAAL